MKSMNASKLKHPENDQYDIREDEEQNVKLQEIIDLLVAAGYFRARIKGLSAFDKVVGGMIWCMESCNFDVNVDLLFQENSTIGQKIALTEKIVTVLPKMECPFRIEPHQIQGLDFIHIFPVIQWLVKRSVTVREEKREFIRRHAVLKFLKQYSKKNENIDNVVENIKKIQDVYRRRRLYKRKDKQPETEELQVESTLLEYCYPYRPTGKEQESEGKSLFSEADEHEETVPSQIMGTIVHSQVQKIAEVTQQFAKLKVDIEDSGGSLIKKQKDLILEKRNTLLEEKSELENEVKENSKKLEEIRENIKQFDEKFLEENNEKQKRIYEKLQSLILLDDSLKNQEKQFREYCKSELNRLQQLVQDALQRSQSQENNATDIHCEEEKEKVQALRLQIAKRNRSIAFLQRQLDEVPGRGELAQYQRRFLELYNQVAQKHEETKRFYTMYNTLDDKKLYLSKELSLLNSVLDNYSEAMSNSIDKEDFMRQFESIVAAIKQNKQKVEKRRTEERNRRDKLCKQLLDLVEQQRNYVCIVKQLRIECKRNEELLAYFRKQS
ncbi:UNVERIFIED_CONTAM: hypothetical protein PYX00_001608 [Menopon gallinae]|uniref:Coiled-coil domain-containing protein 93 n=1 Tax=Menopon gallinae TaxID=328185 RepID=A0AAW2IDP3_9NEOP